MCHKFCYYYTLNCIFVYICYYVLAMLLIQNMHLLELLPEEFDSQLLGYAVSTAAGRSRYLPVYNKREVEKLAASMEWSDLLEGWKSKDGCPIFLETVDIQDAKAPYCKEYNELFSEEVPEGSFLGIGYRAGNAVCAIYDFYKAAELSFPEDNMAYTLMDGLIDLGLWVTKKKVPVFLVANEHILDKLKKLAQRHLYNRSSD